MLVQPATAGFDLTSWPQLDAADTMHGDDGIIRHMLEELVGSTSKQALQLASAALAAAPAFPGLPRINPLISGGGLNTCTKTVAKAKLLPVALLASLEIDVAVRPFIKMIQGARS